MCVVVRCVACLTCANKDAGMPPSAQLYIRHGYVAAPTRCWWHVHLCLTAFVPHWLVEAAFLSIARRVKRSELLNEPVQATTASIRSVKLYTQRTRAGTSS